MDLSLYFQTLAALVPLVVIVSGYLNTHIFGSSSSTVHQIVSWVMALVVAFFGYFMKLGFLAELNIMWTFIYSAALGLVSNGVFDINLIQSFLELIGARKRPTIAKA